MPSEQRWYYSTDIWNCEAFEYSGCVNDPDQGVNKNNFKSKEECCKNCWCTFITGLSILWLAYDNLSVQNVDLMTIFVRMAGGTGYIVVGPNTLHHSLRPNIHF